jgi:hypothetical protein
MWRFITFSNHFVPHSWYNHQNSSFFQSEFHFHSFLSYLCFDTQITFNLTFKLHLSALNKVFHFNSVSLLTSRFMFRRLNYIYLCWKLFKGPYFTKLRLIHTLSHFSQSRCHNKWRPTLSFFLNLARKSACCIDWTLLYIFSSLGNSSF